MSNTIHWDLKCPECGFEFRTFFPEDETEETQREIKTCTCGCEMDIVTEEGDATDMNVGRKK